MNWKNEIRKNEIIEKEREGKNERGHRQYIPVFPTKRIAGAVSIFFFN